MLYCFCFGEDNSTNLLIFLVFNFVRRMLLNFGSRRWVLIISPEGLDELSELKRSFADFADWW